MSDLLKNINILLDEAIASEYSSLNVYVRLTEAYEGLENEKFADVVGLRKPNFFSVVIDKKNWIDELKNIKFHIESKISLDNIKCHIESKMSDKDRRDLEYKESRWKESIGKIHQKDEFALEGIETWYISNYEMIPNYADVQTPLFREEARKLVASGFNLGFNCSNGTGSVFATDCGFVIELWQHMKKTAICKGTLDEVVDWIIHFYDHC
jgi:hypothetical protein